MGSVNHDLAEQRPGALEPMLRHGTPFVVSSIAQYADGSDRETLGLWPLNATLTGLEPVLIARDCRDDFGSPPGGHRGFVSTPPQIRQGLQTAMAFSDR